MCSSYNSSLFCTEVAEYTESPAYRHPCPVTFEVPITVEAEQDPAQIRDNRILQNLLLNESEYLPKIDDYLAFSGDFTPLMRKECADWMLEVIRVSNSPPEVFSLAVNLLDRFLALCNISKSQIQLLACVTMLISSKMREPLPISGIKLIEYTDNSITSSELKEWEILVLDILQWELSAITPLDYLDHVFARINIHPYLNVVDIRRSTETVLVLCATEYAFIYVPQSILVASSIVTSFEHINCLKKLSKELIYLKTQLQVLLHAPMELIDECAIKISNILPDYLKRAWNDMFQVVPDSTKYFQRIPSSPDPDLLCDEILDNYVAFGDDDIDINDSFQSHMCHSDKYDNSCSSPISAVDIFSDLTHSKFCPEKVASSSSYSILVS